MKIIDEKRDFLDKLFVFGIGLVCGVFFTVFAIEHYYKVDEKQERAMVATCKFPRVNGAMTVITMIDDKFTCWVWQ